MVINQTGRSCLILRIFTTGANRLQHNAADDKAEDHDSVNRHHARDQERVVETYLPMRVEPASSIDPRPQGLGKLAERTGRSAAKEAFAVSGVTPSISAEGH
ncbi:hypothetical protein ACNKHO_27105 [Shigella flexneri]